MFCKQFTLIWFTSLSLNVKTSSCHTFFVDVNLITSSLVNVTVLRTIFYKIRTLQEPLTQYIVHTNALGKSEQRIKIENRRKCRLVSRWCRVSTVFFYFLSLYLSLSYILAHLVSKDGGSLSLVGPFSKLNERGRTVWRNRCCHVTVPWLRLARWASVWSNVCYGGWRRRIRIEERSRKQQRRERLSRQPSLSFCAIIAQPLLVARSVGVRNWLGLYAKQQSVFFSLLSASRQSAARCRIDIFK